MIIDDSPAIPWEVTCRMACYAMINKLTLQQVIDNMIAQYLARNHKIRNT